MKSMTGFGRGEVDSGGVGIEVEISSINRKQFDLRVALPRGLAALEPEIAECVRKSISRGAVSVSVRIVSTDKARFGAVCVDKALAKAYIRNLKAVSAGLGLRDDLSLSSLVDLPGVVRFVDPAENTGLWPQIRKALLKAIGGLEKMRVAEGRAMGADIERRLRGLKRFHGLIKAKSPQLTAAYRAVLKQRLEKAGLAKIEEDSQFMREIAYFAERSDISEELVRLDSHFKQAGEILRAKGPAGRKLDFLCQEMLREINTIGSKANSADISRKVIDFKAELESMREQVQNVE